MLVYDVGAFDGADTAYYLAGGHKVVAVEADPTLADKLQQRFSDAIAHGLCRIVNVAVSDKDGTAPFYLSSHSGEWNSFNLDWATRDGATATEITVPCKRFGSILDEYGIPEYLKVDIEGHDHLCVEALTGRPLPKYVSVEVEKDSLGMIEKLHQLGYEWFALVSQQGWKDVSIPAMGTPAHVKWSMRQLARQELRRRPGVHRMLKRLKQAKVQQDFSKAEQVAYSSGPSPMERKEGWLVYQEFLMLWLSVVYSGMIESSWYDVHAASA